MFKTRLLSGIVLVLLALLFIIHGGYLLLTVLGIISLSDCLNCTVYSVLRKCTGYRRICGCHCILSESGI